MLVRWPGMVINVDHDYPAVRGKGAWSPCTRRIRAWRLDPCYELLANAPLLKETVHARCVSDSFSRREFVTWRNYASVPVALSKRASVLNTNASSWRLGACSRATWLAGGQDATLGCALTLLRIFLDSFSVISRFSLDRLAISMSSPRWIWKLVTFP